MISSSSISIDHGAVAGDGDGIPITAVHPDIIQSHILNRLDGPTLAATSCASSQFLSLCNDDALWKHICNSTWPSTADRRVASAISEFPSGHRSFFSDAFPSPGQSTGTRRRRSNFSDAEELISAVDIYYGGELIYSKVLVTETASSWFLCTPLRLELMDPKETVAAPVGFDGGGEFATRAAERLRVSWILIDPAGRRAVNVSSGRAVASRHWLTGDARLRFSVVGAGEEAVEWAVVVSCRGDGGEVRVREVSMQVEDVAGRVVMGMDGLRILRAAMAEERVKSDGGRERDRYERFVKMRDACRERKRRRENGLDMVCIATGISIFFSFFIFLF